MEEMVILKGKKANWIWEEPLPNPQLLLAQILMGVEEISANVRAAYRVLYEALTKSSFSEDR